MMHSMLFKKKKEVHRHMKTTTVLKTIKDTM